MSAARIGGVSFGVVMWICAVALADPLGQFTWTIQDTGFAAGNATHVAAAMRNGLAWPVIIADGGNPPGQAFTLFPVLSPSPANSHWRNIGSGLFTSSTATRLRTASSPDGRVAFVATAGSTSLGGRVSSATGGWTGLPVGTVALAFDKDGNLHTAAERSISSRAGYAGGAIVDIAVSRQGDVGVVDAAGKYWQYSPWVGGWLSATFQMPQLGPDTIDLEFDSFGRPHIIGMSSGNQLVAASFSTVSGNWTYTTISTTASYKGPSTLAANDKGTVGFSWIDSISGMLMYSYKDDVNAWETAGVTSAGFGGTALPVPGLAYDYAGLPVISYVFNSSGVSPRIFLAYDPVVVPEPAGMGLVLAGPMLLRRRPRQAA